jgi:hypothetical protein
VTLDTAQISVTETISPIAAQEKGFGASVASQNVTS